jgi:hypothetical protein
MYIYIYVNMHIQKRSIYIYIYICIHPNIDSPSGNGSLHYIRSIQTIHTVCANYIFLYIQNFIILSLSSPTEKLYVCVYMYIYIYMYVL